MDNSEELPTVLSLCTGYGGIERGLELAGFRHRVITHVEIEAYAIANLVAKMEKNQMDAAPLWTNLKTFPMEAFRDRVSVITGGYPCQPFSQSGKMLGNADPRHLWSDISRIVRTVKPFQCFFENVERHINVGLQQVIEDLEAMDYECAFGIFSAEEIGAPHLRKRVYVMAHRNDGQRVKSQQQIRARRNISGGGGESMAHSGCGASTESEQSPELRATGVGESSSGAWQRSQQAQDEKRPRWPSRPSENQYEWEAPRTIWRSKSKLGGAIDGSASRVDSNQNRTDRLRLLGNGVVPGVAEKAFKVLFKKLNH